MAFRVKLLWSSIYGNSPLRTRQACFRLVSCVYISTTRTGQCALRACSNHATTLSSVFKTNCGRAFSLSFIDSQHASGYIGRNQYYQAKAALQLARSMSQSTEPDADAERLERAFEKSSHGKHPTDGSRLIYEIRGAGMMRFCSVVIYCTSLMAVYMSPDLLSTFLEHDSTSGEMLQSLATIAFAVGVLPAIMILFNRRLILKLFHDKSQEAYVAVTLSPMLTLQKLAFNRKDVIPMKNTGSILAMLKLSTFKVNGRPFYANPYSFPVPSDFNQLMGYT